MSMRAMVMAALAGLAAAGCVAPGKGNSAGGRYIDPYTCEIRNKRPDEPPYDARCIEAARRTAEAAAKSASKKK
jgi:hypothetical protein